MWKGCINSVPNLSWFSRWSLISSACKGQKRDMMGHMVLFSKFRWKVPTRFLKFWGPEKQHEESTPLRIEGDLLQPASLNLIFIHERTLLWQCRISQMIVYACALMIPHSYMTINKRPALSGLLNLKLLSFPHFAIWLSPSCPRFPLPGDIRKTSWNSRLSALVVENLVGKTPLLDLYEGLRA